MISHPPEPPPPALQGTASPERFEFVRIIMGVQARVMLYAPTQEQAATAANLAFARMGELDDMMSDYRPQSELSRLSRAEAGVPHRVSPEIFEVLTAAEQVSRASGGAFDATVGPAVTLWRAARKSGRLPTEAERVGALGKVGWQAVTLDSSTRTATLLKPGMQLDFGGIAKGYAAEQAVITLKRLGYTQCLVGLAGDIATGDAPPGTSGWKVAVTSGTKQTGRSILLANKSISTSGDAEQFIEIGGVRYSHIVDPRTGLGTPGGIAVTVIGSPGAIVDALGKAIVVPGGQQTHLAEGVIKHFPPCAAIIMTPGSGIASEHWQVIDPSGILRFDSPAPPTSPPAP